MRELVEEKEIEAAQQHLDEQLRATLPERGPHTLGFRGGSTALPLHSAGKNKLFYASTFVDRDDTTRRHWNAFGFYNGKDSGSQRIAIEINIAVPYNRAIAAFFAKDDSTNDIYLLHDGKMGGGKEGISRQGFLTHSGLRTVEVHSGKRPRVAVLIGKVGSSDLIQKLENFAQVVAQYKASVE